MKTKKEKKKGGWGRGGGLVMGYLSEDAKLYL